MAVREAVVNAVAHADYAQRGGPIRVAVFADRVEVESPGLLPFGLTIEELPLGVSKLCVPTRFRVTHGWRRSHEGSDRHADTRRPSVRNHTTISGKTIILRLMQ